jgi:hypothetical protein
VTDPTALATTNVFITTDDTNEQIVAVDPSDLVIPIFHAVNFTFKTSLSSLYFTQSPKRQRTPLMGLVDYAHSINYL